MPVSNVLSFLMNGCIYFLNNIVIYSLVELSSKKAIRLHCCYDLFRQKHYCICSTTWSIISFGIVFREENKILTWRIITQGPDQHAEYAILIS